MRESHRLSQFLKKICGYCLRKIQTVPFYRKIVRLFICRIEVKEADEEEIKEFYHWSNPSAKIQILHNPNVTNFVAKKGEKVVGFVHLVRHCQDNNPYFGYWLSSLSVRTFYRGMGVGMALTQAVVEKAISENAKELYLLVHQDDYRAVNLYQKLGFRNIVIPSLEERLEKERLVSGRRRVVMAKELKKQKGVVYGS